MNFGEIRGASGPGDVLVLGFGQQQMHGVTHLSIIYGVRRLDRTNGAESDWAWLRRLDAGRTHQASLFHPDSWIDSLCWVCRVAILGHSICSWEGLPILAWRSAWDVMGSALTRLRFLVFQTNSVEVVTQLIEHFDASFQAVVGENCYADAWRPLTYDGRKVGSVS